VWLKGRSGGYKLITIGFTVSSVGGRNFAMSSCVRLGPKILYGGGGVKKKVHQNHLSENIISSKAIAHGFAGQTNL